jgi:hypothetical protein
MTDTADDDETVHAAIAAVTAAYETAAAKIAVMRDPQRAFASARELDDALGKLESAVADLIALMGDRLWSENELKQAGLATVTGVSKARAHQWIQAARKLKEEIDDE